MGIAPTPKDTILVDGTAQLYRFRRDIPAEQGAAAGVPVLLVPSMINRWYVLDLREGVSLADSLVKAGLDTWLLDWGTPNDEDRYRTWDDGVRRIARMVRRVRRETGASKVVLVGYCMGATISTVYAALHPEELAGFVNLAGPIDFRHAGLLGDLVHRDVFDPEAMTAAGNLPAPMMQSGFTTLRPTQQIAKWVSLADRGLDPSFRQAFDALETWANDNIPFPGQSYVTYIRELYQENRLVEGRHAACGRRVDLHDIRCPVLTITASRDTICPPQAALALNDAVGSTDTTALEVPGGHVGAVVGSKAPKTLYPAIAEWIRTRSERTESVTVTAPAIAAQRRKPGKRGGAAKTDA
jgi:polyhydroxyalkanoate synthase